MWKVKTWPLKREAAYLEWIGRNMNRYQITVLFVNNGYGVEYRPLMELS